MISILIKVLCFVLAILFCPPAFAGDEFSFEKVDIDFNSAIGAGFIQDQDGFFWIGAQTGLIKWDGIDKIIYTKARSGLSNNTVTAVIEDQKGQLWIGTRNGLNKYNKEDNTFVQFKHNPVDPNSLSDDAIGMVNTFQSLIEDMDGYLWIATQNGLNRFAPDSGEFTRFLHSPDKADSLSNNIVYAVFEDSAGTIWVGTQDGLNRLNPDGATFTRYRHDPDSSDTLSSNEVNAISEDVNGNIWVGTEDGLNRLDMQSDSFIRFNRRQGDEYLLADNKITSIVRDRKGRFWLFHYTKGSLSVLDPETLTSETYSYNSGNGGALPTNDAKYMYEDRLGITWLISTSGGNIHKHDLQSKKFVTFNESAAVSNGLKGTSVLPLYEDSDGVIWIGTDKSKLHKYDKESGNFTQIPIEGYHPYAFLEDDGGTFWVGQTTGELSIFDRVTETYSKTYTGLSSSFITNIIQDSKDASILWLTTHKDGLVRFNTRTEEVRQFKHRLSGPTSLSNNSVWTIWQDEDILWLGTWGGGLNRFHKEKETFKTYSHDPQDPSTISSNTSCNLLVSSSGEMYVSTLGGGLNRFNRESGSFEHFSTTNGKFPSDNIEGLLEDKQGNLWIASSTEEIIKFNPKTHDYKVYGPGDGIEIGGPWFVANHKTRDGQMWFGGPKGVTAFYPEQIRNNEFRPPVYITSITQGGEEVVTGKALERVARIDISWKRPFFEFKAAALNYSRPEHNRYKYMLEGWDTEWFYAGDFRNGRYSNLKGGQYTLRVAGSNNDGIWCSREQEAVLTIVVSNPFWRTGWFSFLLAAGVVLMTGCVIFYLLRLRSEINARKEQENALKESERKYRDLIDKAPDIRYRTDIEGRIVFVSDSIHRISGYSQEEAMGMRMAEELYANPADRDEFLSMLQEKEHVENFEAQLRKKDGSIWWGSTNAHFSRDNDGTVLAVEGVTRDVTERKSLQDRLQQAQKMEAIGTLAGGIAHDFNNILGIILGYAEMAKEDAVPGTNQERDLENVLAGADRAKSLVQQILAFSRQSQVEPIQIKIQPLIKEGLKMLRSSIPATISITEDIAPDSGIILADPTQVHQILMNLGTNAYHAMEGSGGVLSVTLKSTFIGSDEKELLLHINSGDYVEFTVSDTGTGMGPDVIEKIFDPYFTTKEIGKGTGMGLAIIHGIVKDYGGTITVESQIGKGTTFHVYFPVVEEGALPDKKEPKDIPIGTERILFVDDEQLLAEMGKVMLERLGYHVTVRRSSLEALETFQNTPNAFDLVITDQTMHGMTGYDLARRMMQIKPDIPIILCTGYSSLIDEESAKSIGIKEFTLKPLTKEVIARLIRKVLGEVV